MSITISARDIALRLNLKKYPRSWRGGCPVCSYPGNVFSVRQKAGHRPRLYCANGCERDQLDDAMSRVIDGWIPTPASYDDQDAAEAVRGRKQAAALRLWSGSEMHGHERYLAARGLDGIKCDDLRYRADCHHPEGGALPAMVALVRDAAGDPVAVHRTYLRRDGTGKADITPDKASLGPIWGGAVRLAEPINHGPVYGASSNLPQLVVAEGIESAASAGLLMSLPAWAALSAGNLAKGLVLPRSVIFVVIAADRDALAANGQHPGQDAAQAAARRWRAEGRAVRIAMPDAIGDFNDILRERGNG